MPVWSRGRVQTENNPPVPTGSRLSLGPIPPPCKNSTDYGNLKAQFPSKGKGLDDDDDILCREMETLLKTSAKFVETRTRQIKSDVSKMLASEKAES